MHGTPTSVSHFNTRRIVAAIRASSGPAYKAEIARATRLSLPTVIRITEDLIAKGLLRDAGKGESSGGKPPQLLEFIGDAHGIVGVDLATDSVRGICINLNGDILATRLVAVQPGSDPDVYLDAIVTVVQDVIRTSGTDPEAILGAGIAIPGILDAKNGTVRSSPDFHWEGVPVLKPLRRRLPLPVLLENDSRAKAIGELWYGLGKGIGCFFCVNYGYGIGAAFAIDGEVYRGDSNIAGEFGHTVLEPDGPVCDCGNHGCLEAVASGQAIARMARELIARGQGAAIRKRVGSDGAVDAETVFAAAEEGDPEAQAIVDGCLVRLGQGISAVVTLMDPAVVIIANFYDRYSGYLLSRVQRTVDRFVMKAPGRRTRLLVSRLGNYDGAIGAAATIYDRWAALGFNRQHL